MKTILRPLSLLAALAFARLTSLEAAPAASPAKAFRISAVERYNQQIIEPGTSEFTVRRLLGEPRHRLNADTWTYENFSACDPKIETGDCTTLLVTFRVGKVAELKLINAGAEKVIVASLQKSLTPNVAVAK